MEFNPEPAKVMHLDLNSCFAAIEQQANPLLRGKPVVVAAYTTSSGCILAASVEAKRFGIKTGMRVKDGKALYPNLVVLPPDPAKYRQIHLKFRALLADYSDKVIPKSIDEFMFKLSVAASPQLVAKEIKKRIRAEIGEWLTVSIGIAPNRFLAKLASSLHKPDGLDEINKDNFLKIYSNLKLTDLNGIKFANAARLNCLGIKTVLDFCHAPLWKLKAAFQSICGYYWYLRLRGWEVDDFVLKRSSYGNSFALPKPPATFSELSPILTKLVEKMSFRLRKAGFKAQGVHLGIVFRDWTFWHKGVKTKRILFDSRDFFKEAYRLLSQCPLKKPVRELHVSCFNLIKNHFLQLEIFENVVKKENLTRAVDEINSRWGNFVLSPARMAKTKELVIDRIAFGSPV